jgi:cell wall-associated NlpC family hydrolase
MSEQGEKIAKAAMEYLGTPHRNYAKVKGVGVDCGMLLIASVEDANIIPKNSVPVSPYSNEWHLHHSEEWFKSYVETYCDKVDELEIGDFVLYQYGRCISHGAVYVGNGLVCHSLVEQGVILSRLDDVIFYDNKGCSRCRGYYRYRGVRTP